MTLRGTDFGTAGLAVIVASLAVIAFARSSETNEPAAQRPVQGISAADLESFGLKLTQRSREQSAELAKDPLVLSAEAGETEARREPLAADAPLKQPGILSLVEVQHRYGDAAPFAGPAWTFHFDAVLPASSRPDAGAPGKASLLVTVDARTGELLAVNGFEPRQ